MHVDSAMAPVAAELFPAPQSEHTAAPVEDLYLPGVHCVHGPPFGPDAPALQMQLLTDPLLAGELELAGQAVQLPAPDAAYVLTPQSVHDVNGDEDV